MLDTLIRHLEEYPDGYQVENVIERINNAFADDLMTMSTTPAGIERKLKKLEDYGKTHGLKMNPKKCETTRAATNLETGKIKHL